MFMRVVAVGELTSTIWVDALLLAAAVDWEIQIPAVHGGECPMY